MADRASASIVIGGAIPRSAIPDLIDAIASDGGRADWEGEPLDASAVCADPAYWAALAARRGKANAVDNLVSLASFKKRLKPGDSLTLLHAPYQHRALGTARKVIQIRSKDFVFEGRSYCDFPRAANFACDGRLVRIAVGNEHEPDAHLLYEWHPIAA